LHFQVPAAANEWKKKAHNYEILWNFPHCIGAVDGKHVLIQAPPHSGSDFYNYKEQFSILLLAIVDAEYNFIYANCGAKESHLTVEFFKRLLLIKLWLKTGSIGQNRSH
jgi:hypothetical protein